MITAREARERSEKIAEVNDAIQSVKELAQIDILIKNHLAANNRNRSVRYEDSMTKDTQQALQKVGFHIERVDEDHGLMGDERYWLITW